jgi:hypothetical protein
MLTLTLLANRLHCLSKMKAFLDNGLAPSAADYPSGRPRSLEFPQITGNFRLPATPDVNRRFRLTRLPNLAFTNFILPKSAHNQAGKQAAKHGDVRVGSRWPRPRWSSELLDRHEARWARLAMEAHVGGRSRVSRIPFVAPTIVDWARSTAGPPPS